MLTTRNAVVFRNPEQVYTEVDDEILMLSVSNGEYYRLNSVASFIWRNLEKPISIKKLIDTSVEHYIYEDTLESDIDELITDLLKLKLIKIQNGA